MLTTKNGCCESDLWLIATGILTWSKCLGVTNTNKAVVVHFSLGRGKQTSSQLKQFSPPTKSCAATHADGGVLVQLVLGGDAEARAVAASGPGQVDCRLQVVTHLLVDGASEFSTIVA